MSRLATLTLCGAGRAPRFLPENIMTPAANPARYDTMQYRSCGKSGLKLPALSLGLWQNFGANRDYTGAVEIVRHAFDRGITHFDLANNYGPPPGAAEELFGRMLARDLAPYRDELIVSTKAGYRMWPGPYGEFGSRKNLLASLHRSLARLKLDYVDIFYSHRYDAATPLEETMSALAQAVRQGKALYVGISSYPQQQTREAHRILNAMGVPIVLHQPSYSVINRWIENDHTIDACAELGIGVIAFSPLSQGVLSGKYSSTRREGTRAENPAGPMRASHVEPRVLAGVERLGAIARARGQSLAQLALAWVLRRPEVTSALIGVRNREQLEENLGALANLAFGADELAAIDDATRDGQMNLYPTQKSWLS
jgi:L-glyceraldehyde 3-phosphate reductase